MHLRGGGSSSAATASDCMSPYDTSALRDMKHYLDQHPDAIRADPPRSIFTDDPAEPVSLASCISPSDLTNHHHDGMDYHAEQHQQQAPTPDDWSVDCCWCSEPWKRAVKLLAAARAGDVEAVLAALDEGTEVDARDIMHMNWTALHHASFYGYPDVIELLVDSGADVNARDLILFTPLHLAAFKGRTDACSALLQMGADARAVTRAGRTPLQKAVYMHHVETIEVICQWMGLPTAPFLAETPPPGVLQQAMEWDGTVDIDEKAGGEEAKETAAEVDAEAGTAAEQKGGRTEEEIRNAAEIRAEYNRRYNEHKKLTNARNAQYD